MQKLEQLAENLEVISKATGYFKLPWFSYFIRISHQKILLMEDSKWSATNMKRFNIGNKTGTRLVHIWLHLFHILFISCNISLSA